MENTNQTPEQKPKKGGKWKILVGVLVLVVVVGAVILGSKGGLFQGRIFRFSAPTSVEKVKPVKTVKDEPISQSAIATGKEVQKVVSVQKDTSALSEQPADESADGPFVSPTVTVTKSIQSPSGSRTTNVNDSLASFKVCAEDNFMVIKGINFKVESYSLGSFGDIVITDDADNHYDTTNYINTDNNVPLYITVYASDDIVIGEGKCETLSFTTDTTKFLRDSIGWDASVKISIQDFITGTLTSYTNSFPVEANEVRY